MSRNFRISSTASSLFVSSKLPSLFAITIVATPFPIRFTIARASDMNRSTPRTSASPSTGTAWVAASVLARTMKPDPVTPVEETLTALTDLVREGKVRYLGCSNVAGWQVADADWTARTSGFERFVSVQNRYSLLDRTVEEEVVPACEEFGLGLLPYFPLEYGLLTGKYHRDQPPPAGTRAATAPAPWLERADWDRIEALAKYAEARDVSILDVAIAGLAAQPAVASVIAGATSGDQVRTNAAALRWEPSEADLVELDEVTAG